MEESIPITSMSEAQAENWAVFTEVWICKELLLILAKNDKIILLWTTCDKQVETASEAMFHVVFLVRHQQK